MSPIDRTFYKVIPPTSPFNLFFDLDICWELNPNFYDEVENKVIERFTSILREEIEFLMKDFSHCKLIKDGLEKSFKDI